MSKSKTKKGKDLPHGRKKGPGGRECKECRWMDLANEGIGNPPGIACRLARGVSDDTPCCDQFEAKGTKVNDKKARKKSGARVQKISRKKVGHCISTGSYYLDLVTGGGIPGGKIGVFFGPEHSGKPTLCFRSGGDALSKGIPVYGFDAEQSWDADYMMANNLDPKHELFHPLEFDNGDEFYRYMFYSLKTLGDKPPGPPQAVYIVDSVAALLPEQEMDKGGSSRPAGPAICHANGLRLVANLIGQKKVCLLFTNHVGNKPMSFGNPEYEKGGDAIKFYSDMRIRVARRKSNGNANKIPRPNFKDKDKKGLHKEASWTGVGKDTFGYAYLDVIKNKGFAGGFDAWMRICTSEASGSGTGVDLAYDLYLCLVATGQAEWAGKGRVELKLRKPVFKDGQVKCLKVRGYYDKTTTWNHFRRMVLDPNKGPNIEEIWKLQVVSGWAGRRLFEVRAARS